jgi:hypothetical protein
MYWSILLLRAFFLRGFVMELLLVVLPDSKLRRSSSLSGMVEEDMWFHFISPLGIVGTFNPQIDQFVSSQWISLGL